MNKILSDSFLKFLKQNNFQKRIDNIAKKYKGKKIVLYGAGAVSDIIIDNFDLSKLNIIGISDIKYNTQNPLDNVFYKNFKAIAPFEIQDQKPDLVLILLREYFRAESYFKKELIPAKGKFRYDSLMKINIFEYIATML